MTLTKKQKKDLIISTCGKSHLYRQRPRKKNAPTSINIQGNKVVWKEYKISPVKELKDMELCDLNETEFKNVLLKKNQQMQENSAKLFNELINKIHEQQQTFSQRD